jgi:tryptophan-rich sensory protein
MNVARPGVLAAFLLLVLGGGFAIGLLTAPGEWYRALAKPPFTPPGWVFPIAWSILYVLIAVAGWRTFLRRHAGAPMMLWSVQLGLNFLWPLVFFAAHRIGLALAIILLLLAAILAFMTSAFRHDRVASLLFVPYAFWVGFACVLNAVIFVAN